MTQGFAENANPFYSGQGLKGHTGQDWSEYWGAPIFPAIKAEVYSLMNQDNPDPSKYRAVFQIYDEKEYSYEISYGHCNEMMAIEGEVYGDTPIAKEGNKGQVYENGREVTKEERLEGSHAGHHVHFQVRKCIRVEKRDKKKFYLKTSHGFLRRNGFYYEIVDYDNGYNGCVDPHPFQKKRPEYTFLVNLEFKTKHPDVKKLQECLTSYGTFTYPEITDYYGEETRKAVYAFQVAEKVASPLILRYYGGKFCHEATRKRLNELFANQTI